MDFDYKKYSLEQLDNWMHDALSTAEATPQEIYDVIKSVVEEQYIHFKDQANRCHQLLTLLNGSSEHTENQGEQRQMTYDEAIAAGWTITADGFWIKEKTT